LAPLHLNSWAIFGMCSSFLGLRFCRIHKVSSKKTSGPKHHWWPMPTDRGCCKPRLVQAPAAGTRASAGEEARRAARKGRRLTSARPGPLVATMAMAPGLFLVGRRGRRRRSSPASSKFPAGPSAAAGKKKFGRDSTHAPPSGSLQIRHAPKIRHQNPL